MFTPEELEAIRTADREMARTERTEKEREYSRKYMRRYREEHREEYNAYHREYARTHRDKLNAIAQKQYQKRRKNNVRHHENG